MEMSRSFIPDLFVIKKKNHPSAGYQCNWSLKKHFALFSNYMYIKKSQKGFLSFFPNPSVA